MQEKDILKGISETLIEKTVYTLTVSIKEPVIIKRSILDVILLRPRIQPELEREFKIGPCVVGNMFRIAGKAVTLPDEILSGTQAQSILPLILSHLEAVVYIVAAGIQNTKREPDQDLIEFIRDNFDADDLYNALLPTLENVGMQSFLSSIALVKGTVRILKPKASPVDGSGLIASHTQQ